MVLCYYCKHVLPESNAKFCSQCGKPVLPSVQPQGVPDSSPTPGEGDVEFPQGAAEDQVSSDDTAQTQGLQRPAAAYEQMVEGFGQLNLAEQTDLLHQLKAAHEINHEKQPSNEDELILAPIKDESDSAPAPIDDAEEYKAPTLNAAQPIQGGVELRFWLSSGKRVIRFRAVAGQRWNIFSPYYGSSYDVHVQELLSNNRCLCEITQTTRTGRIRDQTFVFTTQLPGTPVFIQRLMGRTELDA